MNGKAMGMLILAVVSGLGAMYGTSRLLARDKGQGEVEMQDVVVAARDLKIEEVIEPDLVKTARMAKTAVPAGAFSSAKDVEGRWVHIGMLEGEPVIDKKLAPKGSPPGLIARIPPGMRAFAVEVSEHTGVSGFILPDHRVDVVQTEPDQRGKPEAETILQDVLVLASGQVLTRPEDKSIQARTVTLAVTPEQVDVLVAARARGPLTLALRGLNDHIQAPTKKKPEPIVVAPPVVEEVVPPPRVEKVERVEPPAPPPPPASPPLPPPARFVTIYRGVDGVERVRIDRVGDPLADMPPEIQTTQN